EKRPEGKERQHRYHATRGSGEPYANRKYVDEGGASEHCIPETKTELVVRQDAEPNRKRDDPELERRCLEKRLIGFGASERNEPVAGVEHPIDAEGVPGFVAFQIAAAETDEEGRAKTDDDDRDAETSAARHAGGVDSHLVGDTLRSGCETSRC